MDSHQRSSSLHRQLDTTNTRNQKGKRKLTTFSLSDILQRQPVQLFAALTTSKPPQNHCNTTSAPTKPSPWTRNSSLSIPPSTPLFDDDGLEREEYSADTAATPATLKKRIQVLPSQPPSVPPPSSKNTAANPNQGNKKKGADKHGLSATFIPGYASSTNAVADCSRVAEAKGTKDRYGEGLDIDKGSALSIPYIDEEWTSTSRPPKPVPPRLRPVLPDGPPSIAPPPSASKGENKGRKKSKPLIPQPPSDSITPGCGGVDDKIRREATDPGTKSWEHDHAALTFGSMVRFNDDAEPEPLRLSSEVPLRLRPELPRGPPEAAAPPLTSSTKPKSNQKKKAKGKKKKTTEIHPPPSSNFERFVVGFSASYGERLPTVTEWDEWEEKESEVVALPPNLRRKLPTEPPPVPSPPAKHLNNRAVKSTNHANEVPASITSDHAELDTAKGASLVTKRKNGKAKVLPLNLEEEDRSPRPPAISIPERLRRNVPTEPPPVPPPPPLRNQAPRSSKTPKTPRRKSNASDCLGLASSTSLDTSMSFGFSSFECSSLSPLSLQQTRAELNEDDFSSSPSQPAIYVPERLRPTLPDGPPAIPEPPHSAFRNKVKSTSRKNSTGSDSHPLPNINVSNEILGSERGIYRNCGHPPSPFTDDENSLCASPASPNGFFRARAVPDHPPPIPPPPVSPSQSEHVGMKGRRRSSSSSSQPPAFGSLAYILAKQSSATDSDISSPNSDDVSKGEELRRIKQEYTTKRDEFVAFLQENKKTRGKNKLKYEYHNRWENLKGASLYAARQFIRATRAASINVAEIDLHELLSDEAVCIVLEIVTEELGDELEDSKSEFQPPQSISFITGRGVHSKKSGPTLKPAIKKALDEEGWSYHDWEGGLTVFEGSVDISNMSSSDSESLGYVSEDSEESVASQEWPMI